MDRGPLDKFASRPREGRRIAVIGAGIAGLASAWLLSREHEVVLFEGGLPGGTPTRWTSRWMGSVSGGYRFPGLQPTHLPQPVRPVFLGVDTVESEMSFGVSLRRPTWNGRAAIWPAFRPAPQSPAGDWRMLQDIRRFNRETTRMARKARPRHGPGRLPGEHGYGHAFRDWYLIPMAAAIWSCPTQHAGLSAGHLRALLPQPRPAAGLRPAARYTVRNGARSYVDKLASGIGDVRLPPRCWMSRGGLRRGARPRRRRALRRGGVRLPPTRPWPCSAPTPASSSAQCWGPSSTSTTMPGCTPTRACYPADAVCGRPGTTCPARGPR
jgi:predicted NAD/FAD-binding protein